MEFIEGIKMLGKLEKGQNIDILREYDETRKALFEAIATNIEKPVEIINGDMFKFFPDGDVKIVSGISGDEHYLSAMMLEDIVYIMELYGKELAKTTKTLYTMYKVKTILYE